MRTPKLKQVQGYHHGESRKLKEDLGCPGAPNKGAKVNLGVQE